MRRYGRRKFRRGRKSRRGGRKYIARIARRTIRGMAETKHHINEITYAPLRDTVQSYTFFNGLGEGTDSDQRIGRQITAKRLTFLLQATFSRGSTEPRYGSWIRIVIAYPRKGIDNSELDVRMAGMTPTSVIPPDYAYTLWDRKLFLADNQNFGNAPYSYQFKWSKAKRYTVQYSGSTSVYRQPSIYIVNDIPDGNSSSMSLEGYTRLSFKDI